MTKYITSVTAFIFGTLFAQAAFSAQIVPAELNVCTRDFNPWGQSSQCACPETSRYDLRIGQCLSGEPEAITAEGIVTSEFAIGGETTGLVITDEKQDRYELVVTRPQREQLDQLEAKGLKYRVSGEYLNREGVETGARPTIIVDTIDVIEAI